MSKLLVLCLATAGFVLAGAEKYNIKLLQKSQLNGAELNAGEYKVELDGDKIVIKSGKTKVEAPVKVENVEKKYASSSILYRNEGGKSSIQEIHIGGTKKKLILN